MRQNHGEVLDYAVGKMNKKEFLEMLKNSETKRLIKAE
jgi:hypothetical protein